MIGVVIGTVNNNHMDHQLLHNRALNVCSAFTPSGDAASIESKLMEYSDVNVEREKEDEEATR